LDRTAQTKIHLDMRAGVQDRGNCLVEVRAPHAVLRASNADRANNLARRAPDRRGDPENAGTPFTTGHRIALAPDQIEIGPQPSQGGDGVVGKALEIASDATDRLLGLIRQHRLSAGRAIGRGAVTNIYISP